MADIKELFSLKDRVAIVTGGGQGLGKSMAIGLAQAGANIVIAARRIESAMETKKEIEAIGAGDQGVNICQEWDLLEIAFTKKD